MGTTSQYMTTYDIAVPVVFWVVFVTLVSCVSKDRLDLVILLVLCTRRGISFVIYFVVIKLIKSLDIIHIVWDLHAPTGHSDLVTRYPGFLLFLRSRTII